MRKLILVLGLVVVAFACSETAGEILTDAGQTMMDAGDAMTPDADAQVDDCPCDAGPQGEPGLQGEPGPRGEPGGSGIVAATSFIPENDPAAGAAGPTWFCEFATSQLTVAASQRLLITGQGTARGAGTGGGWAEVSFAVAWREAGDTSAGTMGHFVTGQVQDYVNLELALHTTELTPPLTVGVYETGICVRHEGNNNWVSVTIMRPYGTALVVNSGT